MPTPTITVVHTRACHFCADAEEALTALGRQIPIRVELIEAGSDAGAALVDTHRPSMFPLVLLDGAFFSQGRLPGRKLRAVLGSRGAVSPR
jgi:glutaredoxin